MLKKLIKYTDYDGVERAETFYFNLTKAELMEMELMTVGGMRQLLQSIVDKHDVPKIVEAFKNIIFKSYGEKSPDGRRFIKSKELSEAFAQTEAYSELYMSLISNAEEAAAFINGVVPSDLSERVKAAEVENKTEPSNTENTVSLLGNQ